MTAALVCWRGGAVNDGDFVRGYEDYWSRRHPPQIRAAQSLADFGRRIHVEQLHEAGLFVAAQSAIALAPPSVHHPLVLRGKTANGAYQVGSASLVGGRSLGLGGAVFCRARLERRGALGLGHALTESARLIFGDGLAAADPIAFRGG